MLAVLLAASIDAAQVCAKSRTYKPPSAAVQAQKECEAPCDIPLAQKFANGEGVARDYDVAEFFLCQAAESIAAMEFEGMFEHLQQMRSGSTKANLHFCDHVTSGYGSTYCAHLRYEETMPRLDAQLDELQKKVAEKTQFIALRKAAEAYVKAESGRVSAPNLGGTAYSSIVLDSEVVARNGFVGSAQQWSSIRTRAASANDFKRADDELNAAYRAAMKSDDEFPEWKASLREAQRAWIAYRDAFTAYYAAHWSGKAAEDVLRREIMTQLTRERVAELAEE